VSNVQQLSIVPNDSLPGFAAVATAVSEAVTWVDSELERLRYQRAERDREGLLAIEAMRRQLIDDRAATNAEIKTLVAEQARLAKVLRALDR
jgi:hypothetical protein